MTRAVKRAIAGFLRWLDDALWPPAQEAHDLPRWRVEWADRCWDAARRLDFRFTDATFWLGVDGEPMT